MRPYRTWLADNCRWTGFEFRDGDIIISTPAKCGTTWLQMICALLIFGDPRLPRPLTEMSPWLEIQTDTAAHVFETLAAQEHRRFIKSHTPLDGLPFDKRVTYLCVGRDPRDVAISSDHHLANMNWDVLAKARVAAVGPDGMPSSNAEHTDSRRDRFWRWVEDSPIPQEGLELLLHHLTTFWKRRHEPNVVLVHYADLLDDSDGQMRYLAGRLGVPVDASVWPRLVAAARFDQMQQRAEQLAPQVTLPGLWSDATRFFRRGTNGQWKDLLRPEDLGRYDDRARRLADPDLLAWIHKDPARYGRADAGWATRLSEHAPNGPGAHA